MVFFSVFFWGERFHLFWWSILIIASPVEFKAPLCSLLCKNFVRIRKNFGEIIWVLVFWPNYELQSLLSHLSAFPFFSVSSCQQLWYKHHPKEALHLKTVHDIPFLQTVWITTCDVSTYFFFLGKPKKKPTFPCRILAIQKHTDSADNTKFAQSGYKTLLFMCARS